MLPGCKDLSDNELCDDDVKHFYTYDGVLDMGDEWDDVPIPAPTYQTTCNTR